MKDMLTKILLCVFITGAILQAPVMAQEKKVDSKVKELSGISIIGNQEAPKSLYIVPWQNSEVLACSTTACAPCTKKYFLESLIFMS